MQVSGSVPNPMRGNSQATRAPTQPSDPTDSVRLGQAPPLGPFRPQFPPSLTRLSVTPDLGQVQIQLLGRDLFAHSDSLGFLGSEAARTIGDGARWRQPFPQDWPWPPQEPHQLELVEQAGQTRADISDPEFLQCYQSKPSLLVSQQGGVTHMQARLQNLEGPAKSAWIVAPFAMPPGHSVTAPQAMGVFPILDPSELEPLRLQAGSPASQTWDYHAAEGVMLVTPGASLEEHNLKAYFTSRNSVFGRVGDSHVVRLEPRGGEGPQAFQVFAGIGNYLELEWAGPAAAAGLPSQIDVQFVPVDLKSLNIELEGRRLECLGQTKLGLQAEMLAVYQALSPRPGFTQEST